MKEFKYINKEIKKNAIPENRLYDFPLGFVVREKLDEEDLQELQTWEHNSEEMYIKEVNGVTFILDVLSEKDLNG